MRNWVLLRLSYSYEVERRHPQRRFRAGVMCTAGLPISSHAPLSASCTPARCDYECDNQTAFWPPEVSASSCPSDFSVMELRQLRLKILVRGCFGESRDCVEKFRHDDDKMRPVGFRFALSTGSNLLQAIPTVSHGSLAASRACSIPLQR